MAEGARLESVCAGNRTGGSNPPLSVLHFRRFVTTLFTSRYETPFFGTMNCAKNCAKSALARPNFDGPWAESLVIPDAVSTDRSSGHFTNQRFAASVLRNFERHDHCAVARVPPVNNFDCFKPVAYVHGHRQLSRRNTWRALIDQRHPLVPWTHGKEFSLPKRSRFNTGYATVNDLHSCVVFDNLQHHAIILNHPAYSHEFVRVPS